MINGSNDLCKHVCAKREREDIYKSYAIFVFFKDIDQWKIFHLLMYIFNVIGLLYTKEVKAIESRKIADHHTSMIRRAKFNLQRENTFTQPRT